MLLLLESANVDIDNEQTPMDSWSYIMNSFYNTYLMKALVHMREIPYLGDYVKKLLYEQMAYVHEVTSTYITSHERVEHMAHELPIP